MPNPLLDWIWHRHGDPRIGILPAGGAFAITKSDVTVHERIPRGIILGTAGSLHVLMANGADEVTFSGLVAGVVYPIQAKKFFATGSTADGIMGLD